jgi:hypothetical protein
MIEAVQGIISLFLAFSFSDNMFACDYDLSVDTGERFRNKCRQYRVLLFVCNNGKRFFVRVSYCSNACSLGGIVSGWFMWAWGGRYALMLVRMGYREPSPFGVVASWFVGGQGSILLLAYMVEFGSDGGYLFLQFMDAVGASSL